MEQVKASEFISYLPISKTVRVLFWADRKIRNFELEDNEEGWGLIQSVNDQCYVVGVYDNNSTYEAEEVIVDTLPTMFSTGDNEMVYRNCYFVGVWVKPKSPQKEGDMLYAFRRAHQLIKQFLNSKVNQIRTLA
ncbi:hypothetical protein [Metallosphaera sp.]|uniref:hypothetical protein n=1 Tax=Metallosphaera sp. TaxID=2020860 RepID=UPI00316D9AB2